MNDLDNSLNFAELLDFSVVLLRLDGLFDGFPDGGGLDRRLGVRLGS